MITFLRRLFNRTYTAAIASYHQAIATTLFVVFGCKRRGIRTFGQLKPFPWNSLAIILHIIFFRVTTLQIEHYYARQE